MRQVGGLLGVVGTRGLHVDLEARIGGQLRAQRLEGAGFREPDGHRGPAAAAPVSGTDDLDVAPQVGIVGVARRKFSHHLP